MNGENCKLFTDNSRAERSWICRVDDSLSIISPALAVTLFKALIKTSLHSSAYSNPLQEEELSRAQHSLLEGNLEIHPLLLAPAWMGKEMRRHQAELSTNLSKNQRHPQQSIQTFQSWWEPGCSRGILDPTWLLDGFQTGQLPLGINPLKTAKAIWLSLRTAALKWPVVKFAWITTLKCCKTHPKMAVSVQVSLCHPALQKSLHCSPGFSSDTPISAPVTNRVLRSTKLLG